MVTCSTRMASAMPGFSHVGGTSGAGGGRAGGRPGPRGIRRGRLVIMPAMTISVRESWRASMIMAPRPVCTPVISPTTMTTQEKPRPRRRPVKMPGMAAGRTTRANMAERPTPSMDAASNSRGSTLRTPKMVLTRMGKKAPRATRKKAELGPRPKMIMESGSQAVTGTGRRTCKAGSSKARAIQRRPMAMPSGRARRAASRKAP